MFIVMIVSLIIAGLWNSIPIIKDSAHALLNPTAGALLDYNANLGMLIITAIVIMILTLVQKFTTDHEAMRELKREQKLLQEEIQKYKDHPEKALALQKKQLEFIPKTIDLTARSFMITAIPIILFFRWFNDYFTANPMTLFGFFNWFWAYFILAIIFSSIFRKVFKLP